MPPEYLQPWLHSVESMVLTIHDEFPKLSSVEIEWTYEQLLKYYKSVASGKNVEEPLSNSTMKQALVDEILNVIEAREDIKGDEPFINNPDYLQGHNPIPSLPALYVIGFKRLLKSAIYWRKENGKKGYIRFIEPFIRPSR